MTERTDAQLLEGLRRIDDAPTGTGTLALIVARPTFEERTVLDEAQLEVGRGLVGDMWASRPSKRTADGGPNPDCEIALMGARVAELVAGPIERWPLAGDQLYVDLDLSPENLPAGTTLAIGTALLEVTAEPHTGCAKFSQRFGVEALRFVNSPEGRSRNLRGINARVVRSGTVRVGDTVQRG